MLTRLNIYLPNGSELNYLEFEVHKDPIRTVHSDGIQYRLKIRGTNPLPDNMLHTGIVESSDTTDPNFWIKKCVRVNLHFITKTKQVVDHRIYLLPMSIQTFENNTIQMICIEVSEKILDIDINPSVLKIGINDFTSYFKLRLAEANNNLNDSFNKAKRLTNSGTNPKQFKILVNAPAAEITRSNNTIISGTTMQLADYLLRQGWFECPVYGIYDSFNLERIETDPTLFTAYYDFVNLGMLKNRSIIPKILGAPLSIGDTRTVSQFFDQSLIDALLNKNATIEFIKGGGYDICLDDGHIDQNTNTRIEMPVISGSKENSMIKLCCLKQLVNLNPQVYTGAFAGYLPLDFSIYDFGVNSSIDLPIVINYLFKPMSTFEAGSTNFTVTTNFETLRINTNDLLTSKYKALSINGTNCSLINNFN